MTKSLTISKPFRIVLIVFAVLLALYGAAVLTMSTQWFHDVVEHRVIESLESATGARVEIAALKIQPAAFQLTLHNLTLHGRERASEPPLLTAPTVVIRINPVSLLRRRLLISRLDVEGAALHLMTYADGSTNLPGAGEKPGANVSRLMDLSIGTLTVAGSDLYWNNRRVPLHFTGRRVALLLYFSKLGGYWGSCSMAPLELSVRHAAVPPLVVAFRLHLSSQELALTDLVWRTSGFSGQGGANVRWSPQLIATGNFTLRGEVGKLAHDLGWTAVRAGQFEAQCQAAYQKGKFAARGSLEARQVLLRASKLAPGPIEITSDFSASPSRLSLSNVRAGLFGGSVTGSGEVRFAGGVPGFAVRLRLEQIDMDRALRSVSVGPAVEKLLNLDARIAGTARVTWTGKLSHLQSNFNLQLAPQSAMASSAPPLAGVLQGAAQLTPGLTVQLEQAHLTTPHSSLTAQGILGPSQPGLQVQYTTTSFSESEPLIQHVAGLKSYIPIHLKSPLTFTGLVIGPVLRPEIRGRLNAGAFSFRGWEWQGLAGVLEASSRRFAFEAGQLRSEASLVKISGSVALTDWKVKPAAALNLDVEAHHSALRGLEDALNFRYPLSGFASGQLHLTGTVSSLIGQGDFSVTDGEVDGEPFDLLSMQAVITSTAWNIQNILFKKGTGRMTGWARLDWPHRSLSTELRGAGFSLSQFKLLKLPPFLASRSSPTVSIGGTANFSLRGEGTFAQPRAQLALSLQNLRLNGSTVGTLDAQVRVAGREIHAEGRMAGSGDESSSFTLDAVARENWPAKLSGQFTNFRLDPWVEWLSRTDRKVAVMASGSFTGDGALRHPGELTLQADLRSLTVSASGFVLKNDQPVEVRYAGQAIETNSFGMRGPATNVTLQLAAHFRPLHPTISLQATGNAQASMLKMIAPAVETVGSFEMNIQATGPLSQPALSGQIKVHNLSVRYPGVPLILSDLNGAIDLRGNRVTIVSLSGGSGESAVQISGSATIGPTVVYDLSARLQNVRFEYPVEFTSILNGDLALTGSSKGAELSGNIGVQQMFVSQSFNVVNWLGEAGSSGGGLPTVNPSPQASKIRLNLQITSSPEVQLNSRTLSFVATINAALTGTAAHPAASGEIRIEQGQALIAGNRYRILRGEIALGRPFQTAPALDIEAQTRVDRYNLTIHVTGPADQPRMAYRSDPPLPTEAILSLLALGYAPQRQLMRSTGNEPFGALGASALLSQALSSQVSGRVQQLFGISRVRIDPNLLGPATAGGARITVEERLARNLTITYSTNTAQAEQRDIRIRWDLSRKISLIAERDINGVYGVEVRFHRRLR